MAQTPEQRKANIKFQKALDAKRGKPVAAVADKKKVTKSSIPPWVIALLVFAVIGSAVGPMIFDVIGRIFGGK